MVLSLSHIVFFSMFVLPVVLVFLSLLPFIQCANCIFFAAFPRSIVMQVWIASVLGVWRGPASWLDNDM